MGRLVSPPQWNDSCCLLLVSRIERTGFVENLIAQRAGAVHETVAGVVDEADVSADDRIAPGGVGRNHNNVRIAVKRVGRDVRQVGATINAVVYTWVDEVGPIIPVQVGGTLVTVLNRKKLDLSTY